MARNLPPLNPLRVFEAAGRHQHFTRAAIELGITQAAVSRQIGVLEQWLGVPLFYRQNNEVKLTTAGRRYLTPLSQAFDLIAAASPNSTPKEKQSVLTVRVYATFAMRWLIPRLPRFTSQHPHILVDIRTTVTPIRFRADESGLVIDNCFGDMEEVVTERIFGDIIAPVCHPLLIEHGPIINGPADLANYTLLHSRRRNKDWSDWFSFVGEKVRPQLGCTFDNSMLTYQACQTGIGIAMGQLNLLEAELSSGELVVALERPLARPRGYYLLYPKRVGKDPNVVAFHRWIEEEASLITPQLSAHS